MKLNKKGRFELFILFVLLLFFFFVYLWKSSSLIILPPRFRGTLTPFSYGLPYSDVEFFTGDSVLIKGWHIQKEENQATIILLHGFAVDKSDLLDIAQFLFVHGYSVFLFDFRAHGYSGDGYCSLGYYERNDLRSAVLFLKERGEEKIGVVGFSMGGTVALLEASQNEDILAVVSDCGYLSFRSAVRDFAKAYYHVPTYPFIPLLVWAASKRLRINPDYLDLTHSVKKISPRSIFIIHSRDDQEIRLKNGLTIFENAKEPKEIWIVDNAGHLDAFSIQSEEYKKRVIEFFKTSF